MSLLQLAALQKNDVVIGYIDAAGSRPAGGVPDQRARRPVDRFRLRRPGGYAISPCTA